MHSQTNIQTNGHTISHQNFDIVLIRLSQVNHTACNLESEPVDLAHGDEPLVAAAEPERVPLDGPVGDELARTDVGELGQIHDAAPPVLADPAVAATLRESNRGQSK